MNKNTRYRYEKRIKELQSEINMLRDYRGVAKNIYSGIIEVVSDGKSISMGWILGQLGELLK